jgi:hypothetical protein
MKPYLNMKDEIISFLTDLGIGWKHLINGFIGAFIWSIYRKSKFVESLRQVLIGGFVSAYFTPVVAEKTDLGLEFIGFTSFVIGMLGMVIIDSTYKYIIDKIKKYRDAIIIINKSKN